MICNPAETTDRTIVRVKKGGGDIVVVGVDTVVQVVEPGVELTTVAEVHMVDDDDMSRAKNSPYTPASKPTNARTTLTIPTAVRIPGRRRSSNGVRYARG